jgi:UTP-glucose-1-phosphate uridylyltransferase/mevalonate kinase
MDLFVPGRICLFGEHSDWAGGYRRINAAIEPGLALIAGTDQGLYASVKPHPNKFVFTSALEDGTRQGPYEVAMEQDVLLEEAQKGGFFSYAAGVAYQVLTNYRVQGLEIDNTRSDLPIKKGLSSSASVCVLVARAFNRIYDLKMTVRGEMELAYAGEITTPSRCGRLDQGCAYGGRPILMTFDGDRMDVSEMSVPHDMHFVIVDLCAEKDTREILNQLNHCYPFAEDDVQRGVQEYLGPINRSIVRRSRDALQAGDAEMLGELMAEAQHEFDKFVAPACPSQLTAPALHRLLSYDGLKPFVHGGKGVGSQGDGSAQLIARDAESREKVMDIIERELGMKCLPLTLRAGQRVRKAVVPAAGYGTRLFPATKAVKKELFPVVDSSGRAKPVILAIVEEALSAGVEEVCIVVQREDQRIFEEIFNTPPPIQHYNKLSQDDQRYSDYLMDVGRRITFLPQGKQEGFGHAVHCAAEWVGDEPFMLLLGDHLYRSSTDKSCAGQLLDVYERERRSVLGLMQTPGPEVHRYGCVSGVWKHGSEVLEITEFNEKPDLEYACKHLRIEGLGTDTFLTVFGMYVLTPAVFGFLEEHICMDIRERGEFQLTSCLERVRKEEGFSGIVVSGKRYDIGHPDAYRATLAEYGSGETPV